MREIGQFAGSTIYLDWRDGQQIIVFSIPLRLADTPQYHAVRGLADALSTGRPSIDAINHPEMRVEILHTDEVDRILLNLSDLVAEIRWSHPVMTQLEMVVPELEEALV